MIIRLLPSLGQGAMLIFKFLGPVPTNASPASTLQGQLCRGSCSAAIFDVCALSEPAYNGQSMEQIKICGSDFTHFAPQVVHQVLTCAIVVVSPTSGCGAVIVVSSFVDMAAVTVVASSGS